MDIQYRVSLFGLMSIAGLRFPSREQVYSYIWVYDHQTSQYEDCGHEITKDTEVRQLKDSFNYCFETLLAKRLDVLNISDDLLRDSIDEILSRY